MDALAPELDAQDPNHCSACFRALCILTIPGKGRQAPSPPELALLNYMLLKEQMKEYVPNGLTCAPTLSYSNNTNNSSVELNEIISGGKRSLRVNSKKYLCNLKHVLVCFAPSLILTSF